VVLNDLGNDFEFKSFLDRKVVLLIVKSLPGKDDEIKMILPNTRCPN